METGRAATAPTCGGFSVPTGKRDRSGRKPRGARIVPAVHARKPLARDPIFEVGLSRHLRATLAPAELRALYDRFAEGSAEFDARMRRIVLRALVARLGHAAEIGRGVRFRHEETFAIADGVSIGDGAVLHGRRGGRCRIGRRAWIGAQCFLDARDLVIGEAAGIAPGVRILGSAHTGLPVSAPVMATDLVIRPVRIGAGADIGTGAVILPGVSIGSGAIIGAGAVVTKSVPAYAIAAGVPARVLRRRRK